MRRTLFATVSIVLAVLAAAPGAVWVLLALVPRLQARHTLLAQATSFVHYGVLAWLVAFVLAVIAWALLRRTAVLAVVLPVAAGLLLQASWVVPYYRPDRSPASPVLGLTVLNVEYGYADGELLARRVAGSDVVVLLEVDAPTVAALTRAGMDKRYPHRVGRGAPGAAGTVIYSRLPMTDLGTAPTIFESRLVRVATPSGPLLIAGVHPVHPVGNVGGWAVDGAQLHTWLAPHLGQDIVIAGDFNAVDKHATMQPYWRSGFQDAADSAGSGYARTWPTNHAVAPLPLIGIDHVLVSPRLVAQRHQVLQFPETDHAGLAVTVGRKQ